MKNILKNTFFIIVLFSSFFSINALAIKTHKLQIASEIYVIKAAKREIKRLVSTKTINSSWRDKIPYSVEKKMFDKKEEWLISFKNKEIKDLSKKIIYIFVDLNGILMGSNYTGK